MAVLFLCASEPLRAQGPLPSPPARPQEELDFGRLSLAVGSGARALGMGGAFLARPDDATAASWNPAGLSYLRAPEVSLVGGYNTQDSTTRDATTVQRVEHTRGRAPDFLSVAVPVSLGATSGSVQLSYQRVIPYSGDRTIDEEMQRRFVVSTSGGFDVLALSTGFKLTTALRVGVSVNRWFNGFSQRRERLLTRRPSVQDVDFRISGWSANAGLIVHPHPSVNLGAVARTRMSGPVRMIRSRTDLFEAPDGTDMTTFNTHTSDDVRLDLPGAVGFGASWRAANPLTLSADYTRTFWSHSRIVSYFTLSATPDTFAARPDPTVFGSLPFPYVVDRAQSDTEELRVGVEYVLIAGRLKLPLRVGYLREKQCRVQADGRPLSLGGVTGGAGLVLGPLLLDAAYVYQWGDSDAAVPSNSVRLHRGLVSLIYRHGSGN